MALGISIAALIFSIVIPFVGLILGIIALRRERAAGESGTLAIVAIVLGILGTIVLVFVVAIALIAAFGVFNPDRFVQERCVGDTTKFACTTSAAALSSQGVVQMSLANGVGEHVRITGVTTARDCGVAALSPASEGTTREGEFLIRRAGEVVADQTLRPNDVFIISLHCNEQAQGGVFDELFTIEYDVVGGIGNLRGTVEVVVKT